MNSVEKLIELGFTRSLSRRWAKAIELGARVGFVIVFRGTFAPIVAKTTATILSRRTLLFADVPVGLIDGTELARLLRDRKDFDAIYLRNANVSAMETYFSPLQDLAAQRITFGTGTSKPLM
ncbi:MAG: hypothetical protein EXS64_03590 [Candidatus Latescibacteria bacterium]|nr:hypothetical protein [Candidatus Latescibacterota bacterium]